MGELEAVLEHWLELVESQQQYGESLEREPNRLPLREQLATAIASEEVFVAAAPDETIRGFVHCGLEDGPLASRDDCGRIRALYVAPQHRTAGIGTRLLDAAEADLLDRGCNRLLVDVLAANEPARALYSDRSYEPHRLTLTRQPEVETTTNTNDEG
jgi:GNAT superfamily N-acetyltransferase